MISLHGIPISRNAQKDYS